MNESKSTEPTPEQLLKLLDMQIELARQKRESSIKSNRDRSAMLVGGMLLILVVLMAALFYLRERAEELRQQKAAESAASVEKVTP